MSGVIEKINEAAAMCAERGRTPARAFIGADGMAAIMKHCGWQFAEGSRHVAMMTVAGSVDVNVRDALCEAVIVEDDRGEPWIVP